MATNPRHQGEASAERQSLPRRRPRHPLRRSAGVHRNVRRFPSTTSISTASRCGSSSVSPGSMTSSRARRSPAADIPRSGSCCAERRGRVDQPHATGRRRWPKPACSNRRRGRTPTRCRRPIDLVQARSDVSGPPGASARVACAKFSTDNRRGCVRTTRRSSGFCTCTTREHCGTRASSRL